MKILAFRDRDIEDIEDLAAVLKLEDASAETLRDLVQAVYGDPEVLAATIGGLDQDAAAELLLRCGRIASLLRRAP